MVKEGVCSVERRAIHIPPLYLFRFVEEPGFCLFHISKDLQVGEDITHHGLIHTRHAVVQVRVRHDRLSAVLEAGFKIAVLLHASIDSLNRKRVPFYGSMIGKDSHTRTESRVGCEVPAVVTQVIIADHTFSDDGYQITLEIEME